MWSAETQLLAQLTKLMQLLGISYTMASQPVVLEAEDARLARKLGVPRPAPQQRATLSAVSANNALAANIYQPPLLNRAAYRYGRTGRRAARKTTTRRALQLQQLKSKLPPSAAASMLAGAGAEQHEDADAVGSSGRGSVTFAPHPLDLQARDSPAPEPAAGTSASLSTLAADAPQPFTGRAYSLPASDSIARSPREHGPSLSGEDISSVPSGAPSEQQPPSSDLTGAEARTSAAASAHTDPTGLVSLPLTGADGVDWHALQSDTESDGTASHDPNDAMPVPLQPQTTAELQNAQNTQQPPAAMPTEQQPVGDMQQPGDSVLLQPLPLGFSSPAIPDPSMPPGSIVADKAALEQTFSDVFIAQLP